MNELKKGDWGFLLFLTAFVVLFVTVEWNNGKLETNDFRVYYYAARDFFSGNSPYEHAYGLSTGFFKYPPFTLYLFGTIAWIPYDIAKLLHLTLTAVAALTSFLVMRQLADRFVRNRATTALAASAGWLYLVFAVFAIHLTRELHMGNVNMLLIACFVLGLKFRLEERFWAAALFWGLLLVLKPILILVVLPLVVMRDWNMLFRLAAIGVFFLLFPIVHVGIQGDWQLWVAWFKAAAAHGDYLTSANTISSLVKQRTGFEYGWVVAALVLLLLLVLMVKDYLHTANPAGFLTRWSAVLLAFVPSFFLTDTEHFLFALPLVFLLIQALKSFRSVVAWLAFAGCMVCFSFQSSDLLGKQLSGWVAENGLLGWGNIGFLTLLLVLSAFSHNQPLKNVE